jgi:DNA-binding NarL/FixJ family response regulator
MRIGIAEDQALVRESLALVLNLEPDITVAWTASTGLEAVQLASATPVDLILMDLRLPELDGVSAIRRIRSERGSVSVIVLTTFHHDEWLLDAMNAGATACFLKEVPPKLLIDAMRRVQSGNWRNPADWSEKWRLYAPEIQFQIRFNSQSEHSDSELLTPRELDILRQIAQGATNTEIAKVLYLSEGTVKNYVSTLYAKLGVRHRAEAIRVARERGIC